MTEPSSTPSGSIQRPNPTPLRSRLCKSPDPAGISRAKPLSRLWPFATCRRPPCVAANRAGNRACRRPFRPPSNRPLTQFAGILRLRVRRHPAAKPEKFAYRKRRAGKPACRHDCLPHMGILLAPQRRHRLHPRRPQCRQESRGQCRRGQRCRGQHERRGIGGSHAEEHTVRESRQACRGKRTHRSAG